jgi:diaminopimelate decarboxylase
MTLRPSLYDAYHEIVPVVIDSTRPPNIYNIVGPICESTDIFANARMIPLIHQGEFIAIKTLGAYGGSMSSSYNSRLLTPEIMIKDSQTLIIRHKLDYEYDFYRELCDSDKFVRT